MCTNTQTVHAVVHSRDSLEDCLDVIIYFSFTAFFRCDEPEEGCKAETCESILYFITSRQSSRLPLLLTTYSSQSS